MIVPWELVKQLLTALGLLGYMVGNYFLASWLNETLGIGALIGWGFGFFLLSGIVFHVIWGRDL